MKIKEIQPATVNESEKIPFFHNILPEILQSITLKKTEQLPLFLYNLNNAYVSPYGVVFKAGRVIKASIYKNSNVKIWDNFLSFFAKIIKKKVKNIEGDCVVINHSWYQNYYHWMIEITPRLFLIKDDLLNKKIIVHKNISKFHLDVLSKFNFKEIVFIEDNELVKCESIYFTSFPNYYTNRYMTIASKQIKLIELNINYLLMKRIKQWLEANNSLIKKEKDTNKNKIYISRKKAGHRKILNEVELEGVLDKNGFTKVFLEDYSFDQQIQLLNSSSMVVGIHGAGLTNILFMEPKSHVINLISEHHHEFCYLTIAGIADLNYAHINCKGTNKENPAYNDITIDITAVQKVLASIL
jgi:capsular polysaccharide biosynthesis protein